MYLFYLKQPFVKKSVFQTVKSVVKKLMYMDNLFSYMATYLRQGFFTKEKKFVGKGFTADSMLIGMASKRALVECAKELILC